MILKLRFYSTSLSDFNFINAGALPILTGNSAKDKVLKAKA
jgi:hypothetical protein